MPLLFCQLLMGGHKAGFHCNWNWRLFFDPEPRHRIGVAVGEYMLDLAEISDLFTGPLMSKRKSVLQEVRSNKLTLFKGSSSYNFKGRSVLLKALILTTSLSPQLLEREGRDANSPAFGGRLALFCLTSHSPALVDKSPAFYILY